VPVLRWLVVIVTLLTVAGHPVGAYAAAGVKTDARCCCPDPSTCKCHDRDGRGTSTDSIGKCGGGEHEVALELAVMAEPESPPETDVVRTVRPAIEIVPAIPSSRFVEIEKPPF